MEKLFNIIRSLIFNHHSQFIKLNNKLTQPFKPKLFEFILTQEIKPKQFEFNLIQDIRLNPKKEYPKKEYQTNNNLKRTTNFINKQTITKDMFINSDIPDGFM